MQPYDKRPWWSACRWTFLCAGLLTIFNVGLFAWAPEVTASWVEALQFDREAIRAGEVWRVVTGSSVHWSAAHFLLDLGVFTVVGLLYERQFPRSYPWLLLGSALVIGISLFLFEPDMRYYRGWSGIDSAQFVLALGVEWRQARQERFRWLWLGPALALFLLKLGFECGSGQLLFGTPALGDMGLPVPLAHTAGAAAGLGGIIAQHCRRTSGQRVRRPTAAPVLVLPGTAGTAAPGRRETLDRVRCP